MLRIDRLQKAFGGRTVLRDVSFIVNAGECAGLVGPNGSGKSTLLHCCAGLLRPDGGLVETPPTARIAFLPQEAEPGDRTAAACYPAVFRATGDAHDDRLTRVAARLARETDPARAAALADEYDRLLADLETATARPGVDLDALSDTLGVGGIDPDTPAAKLSGGERTKLGLLECLAQGPDVLLLDEPTNHLDFDGIAWLEAFLAAFPGAALIVSHDRALLDAVAGKIVAIDPRDGSAEAFHGNYSAWADEQARREEEAWERYRRQLREERRIRRNISAIESRARNIENETIDFHYRKRAKKVARKSTVMKARLQRELDSAEHAGRPEKKPHGFYGDFQEGGRAGTQLLAVQDARVELADRTLIEDASFEVARGERVVLSGPNGSGKTTLLRAILGEVEPSAGRIYRGPAVRVGYLPQIDAESDLGEAAPGQTAIDWLTSFRPLSRVEAGNFLHQFLFSHDQVMTPIARMSAGERRRLALARFVVEGANLLLLLLDEPTNHLDLPSREAFESALANFAGGALIVTHDRYFIDQFADRHLELRDGHLRLV